MAFIYPRFVLISGYPPLAPLRDEVLALLPEGVSGSGGVSSIIAQGVFGHEAFLVGWPGWRGRTEEHMYWGAVMVWIDRREREGLWGTTYWTAFSAHEDAGALHEVRDEDDEDEEGSL